MALDNLCNETRHRVGTESPSVARSSTGAVRRTMHNLKGRRITRTLKGDHVTFFAREAQVGPLSTLQMVRHPPSNASLSVCVQTVRHPPSNPPPSVCVQMVRHLPSNASLSVCMQMVRHPPSNPSQSVCVRMVRHPPSNASLSVCVQMGLQEHPHDG